MRNRLLILALLAGPLCAAAATLTFDPARTKVSYKVESSLHTVHGTFKLKSGEMKYDQASGAASGAIVVDAASGGSGARDKRMAKVVLEADKYPEIVFRPEHVEGTAQAKVKGKFIIHGSEHEITIPAEVKMGPAEAAVTLKFAVPYVDWGMKNPGNFLLKVKDTVEIEIETVAKIVNP